MSNIFKYKRGLFISFSIFITLIIFLIFISSDHSICNKNKIKYGITFSEQKAIDLGLDWKKAYINILDELNIKKIRLVAYWNEIEEKKDNFYFDNLDWQITEASKRNVEIILAVGGRLPRWPECHFPEWSKKISQKEKEDKLLDYIKKTINRYKKEKQIVAWQIENEPFLSSNFGECPETNIDFLDKEIELVKKLDNRPIVITDSGELSLWIPAAKRANIFGTTMYLNTYSSKFKRYIHYPIGSWFFYIKRKIVSIFAKPQKWVVIELQAEPWGPIPYNKLTKEEIKKTMSPKKLDKIIEVARQSGFCELYLWGAEYWYWDKIKNRNNEMWNKVKIIFNYDEK